MKEPLIYWFDINKNKHFEDEEISIHEKMDGFNGNEISLKDYNPLEENSNII